MNTNPINKSTFIIVVLAGLALCSIVLNAVLMYKIEGSTHAYEQGRLNGNVSAFRNMFEREVLLSGKEVNFDTRLSLETSVRALNDKQILTCWERFTKAETKEIATAEARNLLEILIQKTSQ